MSAAYSNLKFLAVFRSPGADMSLETDPKGTKDAGVHVFTSLSEFFDYVEHRPLLRLLVTVSPLHSQKNVAQRLFDLLEVTGL